MGGSIHAESAGRADGRRPDTASRPIEGGPAMSSAPEVDPLFLVSLPRSGSTLLQRMLGAHPEISTSPEPTFLLPLLHIDRDTDVVATYDQKYTAWAVQDFVTSLPGGRDDYRAALAAFGRDLYGRAAADGARYHLDKTPKYHLIVDELVELFDASTIVMLWRNPLAVIASMITTWGRPGARWNLSHFRLDLFEGLPNMIEVAERHPERVVEVSYEALVDDPDAAVERIVHRLGLSPDHDSAERFSDVQLVGRIQDPNAQHPDFQRIRTDRVDEWREVLANPLRRAWCRRYLEWLGPERLARMGYELAGLLDELDSAPRSRRHLATDLVDMPLDLANRAGEIRLLKKKIKDRRSGRRLLAHK